MNTIITLTETRLIKNPNTKTTYIVESREVKEVTERQHNLCTNNDTVKWFRRIGGKETVQRSYTNAGYLVTKLISTSPDKQTKIVREYEFKTVEKINTTDFESLSLYGKFQNLTRRNLMNDKVRLLMIDFDTMQANRKQLENELNKANKSPLETQNLNEQEQHEQNLYCPKHENY